MALLGDHDVEERKDIPVVGEHAEVYLLCVELILDRGIDRRSGRRGQGADRRGEDGGGAIGAGRGDRQH